MARTKKTVDKEHLRQRRVELYDAIARGELTLQHAVKEMRSISRLTQAEFASHRGVSTKTIKEIENGKGNPTVQTLNRIGQFFGLEVAFVRSENLRERKMPAVTTEAPPPPPPAAMRYPLDDAQNLILRLEDLKKLASPSTELQELLKNLESNLKITDPIRALQKEYEAIEKARQVIGAAEQIQRQIQPPAALTQWLSDLDRVNKILAPLNLQKLTGKK